MSLHQNELDFLESKGLTEERIVRNRIRSMQMGDWTETLGAYASGKRVTVEGKASLQEAINEMET